MTIESWEKVFQALNSKDESIKILSLLEPLLLVREGRSVGCSLLQIYRTGNSVDEMKEFLPSITDKDRGFPENLKATQLRARTVCWFLENHAYFSNQASKKGLESLFKEYCDLYHQKVWTEIDSIKSRGGSDHCVLQPWAWVRLKEVNQQLGVLVNEVISSCGFHFPGAALLVDTLLELSGKPIELSIPETGLLNPWLPGQTWILLALQNPKQGEPPGLLLRLRIEKISGGCGVIYPHPRFAAHLNLADSFTAGIRNAWSMVLLGEPTLLSFDYRWWVTVVEPEHAVVGVASETRELAQSLSTLLLSEKIGGESATLAFALALKSVIKEQTLRRDLVASACFHDTSHGLANFGWGTILSRINSSNGVKSEDSKGEISGNYQDIPIFPVGDFANKDAVITACKEVKVSIQKIVTAQGQTTALPSNIQSEPQHTFLRAYREFSELESFLSDFAKERAGRWRRLVEMGAESEAHDRA